MLEVESTWTLSPLEHTLGTERKRIAWTVGWGKAFSALSDELGHPMSLLTQRMLELPWSLKWGLRRQCQVFSRFMSPCTHASFWNLYFTRGTCDTLSPAGVDLCVRALRFPSALMGTLRVWGTKDPRKGRGGQHVFQTADSRLVVTKEPSHARKCWACV